MTKPLLRGVLKTWKEDRGFGFISPENGSRDVFIHISALGQTTRRPIPGDMINYQITRDRQGKLRAVNASIEGVNDTSTSLKNNIKLNNSTVKPSRLKIAMIVFLMVLTAGAAFFYFRAGGSN